MFRIPVNILLVCTAMAMGLACGGEPTTERTGTSRFGYACPVHPEITSPKPGNCGICGRTLTSAPADTTTLKN